jgi:5-hydroxyisourate hydrolase-like protein (transthyretin family)
MIPFRNRTVQTARRTQPVRRVRPVLEGLESRQLLSATPVSGDSTTDRKHVTADVTVAAGGNISGTVFNDLTGNGFSSDDQPGAGVTIDLFKYGGSSSAPVASAVTDQSGKFRFANLAPAYYTLREVVPKGWIQTGGIGGYTVLVQGGQTIAHQDLDNFQLLPPPSYTQLQFTVTTPSGQSKQVSSLDGNVKEGDKVTATFNLQAPEVLTLVSYIAPNHTFDTWNLQHQVIFSRQSTTATATGPQTLTITVPNCYFQVDFVAGPAINHLATNANITYHAQDRFLGGEQGGSQIFAASTLSGHVTRVAATTGVLNSSTGIPGVTVVLTGIDAAGEAVSEKAVTDQNGAYTFTNLSPSNAAGYTISEILPTGYVEVGVGAGSTGIVGQPSKQSITTFLNTNTSSINNDFFDAPMS